MLDTFIHFLKKILYLLQFSLKTSQKEHPRSSTPSRRQSVTPVPSNLIVSERISLVPFAENLHELSDLLIGVKRLSSSHAWRNVSSESVTRISWEARPHTPVYSPREERVSGIRMTRFRLLSNALQTAQSLKICIF